MPKLYLYNTLTRKKDEFEPINHGRVGLYTCGPTVYNYAHIGNLRTYIFEDILKRILKFDGYKVKHVMNVTDVGHLTGDRDMGEDKLEKGAKREGKSAWEIAAFYWAAFRQDIKKLNITEPDIWCKATDHIKAQIKLVKKLEQKGFTYKTSDGIYFDTAKFPAYNKLSRQPLETLQEGARVEKNDEKKNPTDFALWKFSPQPPADGEKRQMEWPSPWGIGFPGWHIECSAMSLHYLKGEEDIHCGGVDHINIHHTNEIAQSEAATGKKFFNWWMHGAFLNLPGGDKMAKSADNFLNLENAFIKNNINPLAYRYAALQTHYRKPMEYKQESIRSAENGLNNLYEKFLCLKKGLLPGRPDKKLMAEFASAINDDLNLPAALAVAWQTLDAPLPDKIKRATLLEFDTVLGLGLNELKPAKIAPIPPEIMALAKERQKARKNNDWPKADEIREKITQRGYHIKDNDNSFEVKKNLMEE